MNQKYIETDLLLMMTRERNYNLHKTKIDNAEKRVDNSSPFDKLPRVLTKSPINSDTLLSDNMRIYAKLNRIYSRPINQPKSQVIARSTPSINRKIEALRIASENEYMIKRLVLSKPTYSYKKLKQEFKDIKEMSVKLSRYNQLVNCKKIVKSLHKNPV